MRFSLKWMLGAVAFVGFGSAALFNATKAWAMASFGLTAVVLLAAILGSIYLRPKAFYVGVCIFGWGYLILTYVPPMRNSIRPLAATDALLDVIYKTMQHDIPAVIPTFPTDDDPIRAAYPMPSRKYFHAVGHSLFALVFAIIGGLVGQWFSRQCNTASER